MRVRFSFDAEADLLNAIRHIALDSPKNAIIISQRVSHAAERLRTLPYIGRIGRVEATREGPVPKTPYVLIYRVLQDEVEILRILHGRQDWPSP